MEFRFNEEVNGHRAEWASVQKRCAMKHIQAELLDRIANRLAGPLYGGMIGLGRARELITSQEWTPAVVTLQ